MNPTARTTGAILLGILLLTGVVTWYVWQQSAEPSPAASALSDRADRTAFTDLSDTPVSLAEQLDTNTVLLVNSWASWCPFCADELQLLNALAQEFAPEVSVVAINRRERSHRAQRFLQEVGDLEHVTVILDPDDRFYSDVEGYTMPETIVYDQDGAIHTHIHGPLDESRIRQILEALAQ